MPGYRFSRSNILITQRHGASSITRVLGFRKWFFSSGMRASQKGKIDFTPEGADAAAISVSLPVSTLFHISTIFPTRVGVWFILYLLSRCMRPEGPWASSVGFSNNHIRPKPTCSVLAGFPNLLSPNPPTKEKERAHRTGGRYILFGLPGLLLPRRGPKLHFNLYPLPPSPGPPKSRLHEGP